MSSSLSESESSDGPEELGNVIDVGIEQFSQKLPPPLSAPDRRFDERLRIRDALQSGAPDTSDSGISSSDLSGDEQTFGKADENYVRKGKKPKSSEKTAKLGEISAKYSQKSAISEKIGGISAKMAKVSKKSEKENVNDADKSVFPKIKRKEGIKRSKQKKEKKKEDDGTKEKITTSKKDKMGSDKSKKR